tara:strand:- start:39 stop:590 length:552 start_codon:yes stop_codon:yes gene_type:complete
MKKIKGFNGYLIDKNGNLFSEKTNKYLKSHISKNGYERIGLVKEKGKVKFMFIHRILAQTFIFNPLNKTDVNHKNGIKYDNRLINLEWNTRSENVKHAFNTGLNKVSKKARKLSSERAKKYVGKNSPQARSVVSINKTTNEVVKIYDTITDASKDLGCLISSISNCLKGKSNTCNNLKWKYNE